MVSPRLARLDEIEGAVWRELERAVHDKAHGWRVCVLATAGPQGADARSVVLREFDAGSRTLMTFTDSRSPKVPQVQASPQGVLVLWCAALSWQLRLNVNLQLHTEGLMVSSRWARLKMTPGAQDYLSPLPPGSPLDAPPPALESRVNFAVLEMQVQDMDWLELHAEGHRRARFSPGGTATWLTP